MTEKNRKKEIKWDKLDNTANVFPVIAGESMTNVYRISVTLQEEIQQELLQEALERVLPWFDVFCVRIRYGVFWYYFETNFSKPEQELPVSGKLLSEPHQFRGLPCADGWHGRHYFFAGAYLPVSASFTS